MNAYSALKEQTELDRGKGMRGVSTRSLTFLPPCYSVTTLPSAPGTRADRGQGASFINQKGETWTETS